MSYGVKIVTGTFTTNPVHKITALQDSVWTADIDTDNTAGYDATNGDTTGLAFELPAGSHLLSRGPQGQVIYYKNISVSSGKIEVNFA